MNASKIMLLVSVICFVLACFGVDPQQVRLIPLGLAFLAGSMLV